MAGEREQYIERGLFRFLKKKARQTDHLIYETPIAKEERSALEEVAGYMHDTNIQNVVLIDRAARLAYIGIRETWKRKYPSETAPQIYFVNPYGFSSKEGDISPLANRYRGAIPLEGIDGRLNEEIRDEFEQKHHHLASRKNHPTLIFDVCIHTGGTLRTVHSALKNIGFTELKTAAVRHENKDLTFPLCGLGMRLTLQR